LGLSTLKGLVFRTTIQFWTYQGYLDYGFIWHRIPLRYDVRSLLRLHKIVKDLGMGEKEIIKVLELAKYDELQNLQWKVEYLRNEVNMLEMEKWKSNTKTE
jgi:hypothetical protein